LRRKPGNRLARLAAAITIIIASGLPCAYGASFMELMGAVDTRNPYSARILPLGPQAAYFNPALLPDTAESGSLSLVYVGQLTNIGLQDRPTGADVSSAVYDARLLNPDGSTNRLVWRPLATGDLRQARGSSNPGNHQLYATWAISRHIIEKRLTFALYALLPATEFQGQSTFFSDEREQFFSNSLHFEMLGDRTRMYTMSFALGGKPLDWLGLGVGVTLAARSQATSYVYVADVSYQEASEVNADLKLQMRLVPHLGFSIDALDWLRVTGTVHFSHAARVDGKSDLQLWNYPYDEGKDSLLQTFKLASGYEPLRASLGVAVQGKVAGAVLNGALGTQYARWSQYEDRHQENPADSWSDTFTVTAGGNVETGRHRFGLDLAWIPTPVPAQTGRSNYVDNTRLGLGGGYEIGFPIKDKTLFIGAGLQGQFLVPRSVDKSLEASHPVFDEFPESIHVKTGEVMGDSDGFQSNNPGYPGFSSDGWLLAGSLFVKMEF
jgi:long-chain fatty acid transport protein